MANYIKLNSNEIPHPGAKNFKVSFFVVSDAGRVANGDMVIDFIAEKQKIHFKYDVISQAQYNTIMAEIKGAVSISVAYTIGGTEYTFTGYPGEISFEDFRRGSVVGQGYYYTNVSFNIIEI